MYQMILMSEVKGFVINGCTLQIIERNKRLLVLPNMTKLKKQDIKF